MDLNNLQLKSQKFSIHNTVLMKIADKNVGRRSKVENGIIKKN